MKLGLPIALLLAVPAAASTPAAWNALDARSSAACAKASNLVDPAVGPSVRFGAPFGVDVREVTGTYRPRHMLGAKARMLCLVERRSGRVEVQEKPAR